MEKNRNSNLGFRVRGRELLVGNKGLEAQTWKLLSRLLGIG